MRFSQRAVAAILWLASCVVLCIGYVRVEIHEAGRVKGAESDARALQAKIARAEAIVHDRLELKAARKRIVTDIRAQASYGAHSDLTPMLTSLDRASRRAGIALVSIEPKALESGALKDHWLHARAVHLILRGTFGRLLAFLPAFSQEDPLLRLRAVQISSSESGGTMRPLTFAIDADAYGLDAPNIKE